MSEVAVRWYHWVVLSICSAWMLTMGVLDIVQGPAADSRLYAVDNFIVRAIGILLVPLAVLLFWRTKAFFVASIAVLGTGALELLLLPVSGAFSSTSSTISTLTVLLLLYGAPIAALAWLLRVFVSRVDTPSEANLPLGNERDIRAIRR